MGLTQSHQLTNNEVDIGMSLGGVRKSNDKAEACPAFLNTNALKLSVSQRLVHAAEVEAVFPGPAR